MTQTRAVEHVYQQDRNGNVTHLMSFQGTVLEEYRYDAFGKWTLWNEPTGSYNNRFYFTGREWTGSALGFYEYRNRAYHPGIGRFMSEEPKGFDGGDYNLYRYCGNDPLDHTDPTGLGTEQIDDHNQSAGHDGIGGAWGPGLADRFESSVETAVQYDRAGGNRQYSMAGGQMLTMHDVTVQAWIQRSSIGGDKGNNHGPTISPSGSRDDYKLSQTLSIGVVTSEKHDVGPTYLVDGRYMGTAHGDFLALSRRFGSTASIYMAGKSANPDPRFMSLAPPISYAMRASVNFGARSITGSFTHTQFPSFQVWIDGRSVYTHSEVKGAAGLYFHETDAISTSY